MNSPTSNHRRAGFLGTRVLLPIVLIIVLLHIGGLIAYALKVRASARILIESAKEIRSLDDAQRLADRWDQTSIRRFEAFHSPGYHTYTFEVKSGLLTTFHMVPSTGMLLQVKLAENRRGIVLGMYNAKASAWVQEDSALSSSEIDTERNRSGLLSKTYLMLGSATDQSTRAKALSFNVNCLAKPGGCASVDEMLPTARQLEKTLPPHSGSATHLDGGLPER